MAGEACTVRMISKSQVTPQVNYAQFTPGVTSAMVQGTHNGLIQFPNGVPQDSTFALVEIDNSDFSYLFDCYLDRDDDRDAYEAMLLKELANVYYFYLIPPSTLADRIASLGSQTAKQALASPQRPQWQVDVNPRWDIRLNGKKVLINDCFVHQCFKSARTAFTFRVQFGCASGTGSELTAREVTGIVLYFAAHEPRPVVDERATPISEDRNVFVLWNGKMFIKQVYDFWGAFKFDSPFPADVLQRTVVFLDFSRSFKPKANKEELDDATAVAKFSKICGETQQKSLRAKMKSFLTNCWNSDAYDKVLLNGTSLEGVEVANKQKINFHQFYDLTWLEKGGKTMRREVVLATHQSGGTNGTPVVLNLQYPNIRGSENIGGIQVETRSVPAKDIRKVANPLRQNFRDFVACHPQQLSVWRDHERINGTFAVAVEAQTDLQFKLLNNEARDVFSVEGGLVACYFEKFACELSVTIKPADKKTAIPRDFDVGFTKQRCWLLKDIVSLFPGVGTYIVSTKLKNSPTHLAQLVSETKIVVEPGDPVEILVEEDRLIVGANQVHVSAKDKLGNSVQLEDDSNHWLVGIASDTLTASITGLKKSKGQVIMSIKLDGKIGPRRSKLKFVYRGRSELICQQMFEILPGAARHLQFQLPRHQIVNHDVLPAPTATVTDEHGNKVNDMTSWELYIEDNVVQKFQKLTAQTHVWSQVWAPTAINSISNVEVAAEDVLLPSFANITTFDETSKSEVPVESYLSSTQVCELMVAVGDVVLLKAFGQKHLCRIQSISSGKGKEFLLAEYFASTLSFGNTVPDLTPREIVMSSKHVCFPVRSISECEKYFVLSKQAFDALPIVPSNVLFCERITTLGICHHLVGSAEAGADLKGIVKVAAVCGHHLYQAAIEINTSHGNEKLFENPSFSSFCRNKTLFIGDFDSTRVFSRCAVTYNGRLLNHSTTIAEIGLTRGVPFVFSYMRAALDEHNQTLRLLCKSKGPQAFWNETRCTVLPGRAPLALRFSIAKSDPLERGILQFVAEDLGGTRSPDKLTVSRGLTFTVTCQVLDEASRLYAGGGTLSAFESTQVVKNGTCEFEYSTGENRRFQIKFDTEGASLSRDIQVLCKARPATKLRIDAQPCQIDSEIKMRVAFSDDHDNSVERPANPRFRIYAPASLFGEKSQQPREIMPTIGLSKYFVELKFGPLKGKSCKSRIEVVGSDGDGFEFGKHQVPVELTPGPPHRLMIEPHPIDGLKSGEYFPDLQFCLFDSYNNQIHLPVESLNLVITDEGGQKGHRFVPDWEEGSKGLMLKCGSILCLKSTTITLSCSVRATRVSAQIAVNVAAGHVPHTLHAEFIHSSADSITLSAGDNTREAKLNIFVNDELEDVVPANEYEVAVSGVFPDDKRVQGTPSRPFSPNTHTFTQSGTYKIYVSITSVHGNLGPIERTVHILPDKINDIAFEAPKRVTLDAPFPAVLTAHDKFGNFIETYDIFLSSSLTRVSLLMQTDGDPSPYLSTGSRSFVFTNPEGEDPLPPGDHKIILSYANLPKFKHDIVVVIPAPTQRLATAMRAPSKKRVAAPVVDNSAIIRQLEGSIGNLKADIQVLQSIVQFVTDAGHQAVWQQNSAEANLKRDPHLIALPMVDLCNFVLPDLFMRDVEKMRDPVQFLRQVRGHVSRNLSFLRWIALDMPNRPAADFYHANKELLKKLPKAFYKFIQLSASTKLQAIPNHNRPLLENLVVPDSQLEVDVQQRVAVAILSAIKKRCTVYLQEAAFDKVTATQDPSLCLETGELRVKVGQNLTAERGTAQYNGPLIRVKATANYVQNLTKRLQDKQKALAQEEQNHRNLSAGQPPSAKRAKRD
eukprot:TRINITY_DN3934_c0_g1_i1.p1 TRINITY_DN3934_c0_g1~~TRINITY_DN3934_c0_g1_i1.p1  ORF type:complete len:2116 (-),score=228.66 TRINITY_DN3934_c0_g1_i1:23-5548(-)